MGRTFSRRGFGRGVRNALAAAAVTRFAAGSASSALAAPASQVTTADGRVYDAYVQPMPKHGQFYNYTCEFDAAWMILAAFGHDRPFEELLEIVGHDVSIEPWYEETPQGFVIYGGDITSAFSGDFTSNPLARASGAAFKPLFEHYDLSAMPISTQEEVQTALDNGQLIWTKATVDFLPWADTTWITPAGDEVATVLGNDHCLVVNGYNQDVVVISDPLGPTSTNWERPYEYEVPWATFLGVWAAQQQDALAVGPASASAAAPKVETINPSVPVIEITGGA
jgi:uncharacterized protein YvpB